MEVEAHVQNLANQILSKNPMVESIGPHETEDTVLAFMVAAEAGVGFDKDGAFTVSVENIDADATLFFQAKESDTQTREPDIFIEEIRFDNHGQKSLIKMPWRR